MSMKNTRDEDGLVGAILDDPSDSLAWEALADAREERGDGRLRSYLAFKPLARGPAFDAWRVGFDDWNAVPHPASNNPLYESYNYRHVFSDYRRTKVSVRGFRCAVLSVLTCFGLPRTFFGSEENYVPFLSPTCRRRLAASELVQVGCLPCRGLTAKVPSPSFRGRRYNYWELYYSELLYALPHASKRRPAFKSSFRGLDSALTEWCSLPASVVDGLSSLPEGRRILPEDPESNDPVHRAVSLVVPYAFGLVCEALRLAGSRSEFSLEGECRSTT